MKVYALVHVLLVSHLFQRDCLLGERAEPSIISYAILHILGDEMTFASKLKEGAVLVKHNMRLLAVSANEPGRSKRRPPEDRIGSLVAEHVGGGQDVVLPPDTDLLAIVCDFALLEQ